MASNSVPAALPRAGQLTTLPRASLASSSLCTDACPTAEGDPRSGYVPSRGVEAHGFDDFFDDFSVVWVEQPDCFEGERKDVFGAGRSSVDVASMDGRQLLLSVWRSCRVLAGTGFLMMTFVML